ncbi:PIN domain nuclease [Sulfodiicoccus acidiphilus]|uniref:PIN domain nuclease n=1 Tax=Sulfodiicoccus acidiphilus TaxID=1670455 RepID=A0A348B5E3_9CREN|nr:type II toxin-antitoxin system VapC family toxin [Sulfodiicoccus acidiphilus]BBD73395.1 PIN domain nuclease [Sulfodiicoccus acidiphilus]GGT98832.1 PIN domain nuclease [Sulfodiicoccus acidiphilus]
MIYVFDTSSIYTAVLSRRTEVLGANYTVPLSRFELGNVVWKEVAVFKRITKEEGERLFRHFLNVLDTMNLKDVNYEEVEEMAVERRISFYDASYVWLARELKVPLVTEDEKLRKAAGGVVRVVSSGEV